MNDYVEWATSAPNNLTLVALALLSTGMLLLYVSISFGPWFVTKVVLGRMRKRQAAHLKKHAKVIASAGLTSAERARRDRFF